MAALLVARAVMRDELLQPETLALPTFAALEDFSPLLDARAVRFSGTSAREGLSV